MAQSPLIPPFLDEFLGLAFKDGKPSARNVLDGRSPRKQGKSALAGAVGLIDGYHAPLIAKWYISCIR